MPTKKDLSERDIITKCIIPAILKAGWDSERQVREEVYFTDGRIFVKGNKTARGERKRADIILYHKPNIPLAIIEAKDNNHALAPVCSRLWTMRKFWIFPWCTVPMATVFLSMTGL